jgi:hypothetical protein
VRDQPGVAIGRHGIDRHGQRKARALEGVQQPKDADPMPILARGEPSDVGLIPWSNSTGEPGRLLGTGWGIILVIREANHRDDGEAGSAREPPGSPLHDR